MRTKFERIMYRARNICYYYRIDTRPRSVYLHVIRELRNDMKSLLAEFPQGSEEYETLLRIVRSCPQKIKEEECESYILETLSKEIGYEQQGE